MKKLLFLLYKITTLRKNAEETVYFLFGFKNNYVIWNEFLFNIKVRKKNCTAKKKFFRNSIWKKKIILARSVFFSVHSFNFFFFLLLAFCGESFFFLKMRNLKFHRWWWLSTNASYWRNFGQFFLSFSFERIKRITGFRSKLNSFLFFTEKNETTIIWILFHLLFILLHNELKILNPWKV